MMATSTRHGHGHGAGIHQPIQPAITIDLTLDDTPIEDAYPPVNNAPKIKKESSFVSTLAHRSPSRDPLRQPSFSLPQKRKSADSAESSARQSRKPTPVIANNTPKVPSTPSPARQATPSNNVEVVIISPPAQKPDPVQKEKEPPRYSSAWYKKYFPVNAEETAKAAQRRYPAARNVDRSAVPFKIEPRPLKWTSITATQFLRHMQKEKLARNKGAKLSFDIDDENLAILSSNFGFVNEYKLQDGVTPCPSDFIAGCVCNGPCKEETCDCLMEEDEASLIEEGVKKEEVNQRIVPYQEVDGRVVLRRDFLERKSIISECSSKCSCTGQCWNHVVQRGRSVRLQIFNTGSRGFGLRTLDPIITGQFIDLYLGEVVTKKEAEQREAVDEQGQSYLFSLDWYVDDDDIYVVDGQKFGSPTRFINHSCNPNCKIIPVTTTGNADQKLYYLAFFAIQDIPAGTEVTFDYHPGWTGSNEVDPDAVPCLCGEPNCRGQLWPNQRKQGSKE